MSCIIGSLIVEYDFCEAQTIPCEAPPRPDVTAYFVSIAPSHIWGYVVTTTWFAEVYVAMRCVLLEGHCG